MPTPREPALGLLELSSIARGLVVADAAVKKAPVRLLRCHPVSPGKHLTLLAGGVDEVFESMRAGEEAAGKLLLGKLFLPQVHPAVFAASQGEFSPDPTQSIGTLEYTTVAATLLGADAALKAADVVILEMRLAQGLGGKGYVVLAGVLHMLEAAMEAGLRAVPEATHAGHDIIANPHPEMVEAFLAQLSSAR